MNKTKLKILHSALKLFNEAGTIKIIIQKIADEAEISIGNLTYHFKNKEAIIVGLFDVVNEDVNNIFLEMSLVPSEEEVVQIELKLFEIQDKYRFMFLDTLSLIQVSPSIAIKFRDNMKHQINLIYTLMRLGVMMKTYKEEKYEGYFMQLSKVIWNLYFNRITRAEVMGEDYGLVELGKDIWMIIQPCLTDEGRVKYKAILDFELEKIEKFNKV